MSAGTLRSGATGSEVRTYANVAFETALKDWMAVLGEVVAAFGRSPGLQSRLADPTVEFAARQKMLLPLLPADTPTAIRNFLFAMLANGDITLLDEVLDELNAMTAAAGGPHPIPAEITSAVALTDAERQAIENRLSAEHGTHLDFHFKVDPAIMGGLVVRVGDKLLDTSVASKLAALRQSLGRAGS